MTVLEEGEVTRWGRVTRGWVEKQVSTEDYIEENVGIEVVVVDDIDDLIQLATI